MGRRNQKDYQKLGIVRLQEQNQNAIELDATGSASFSCEWRALIVDVDAASSEERFLDQQTRWYGILTQSWWSRSINEDVLFPFCVHIWIKYTLMRWFSHDFVMQTHYESFTGFGNPSSSLRWSGLTVSAKLPICFCIIGERKTFVFTHYEETVEELLHSSLVSILYTLFAKLLSYKRRRLRYIIDCYWVDEAT